MTPGPTVDGTDVRGALQGAVDALEHRLLGKGRAVREVLGAVLAGGHVLMDDVPGVGKTLFARTLMDVLGLSGQRIQGSVDLLPSDVTGVNVFDLKAGAFHFRPGPIFTEVLLVDEINRCPPRTQGAFLEAMEERRVSVDGQSHPLPDPFVVLATESSLHDEGTFALTTSQLDRFLMRVHLGYPTPEEASRMILEGGEGTAHGAVLSPGVLQTLVRLARAVPLHPDLADYIARLLVESRRHPRVALGLSPRAGVLWGRAARARAFIEGRPYVLPDDVQELAPAVVAHRLVLKDDDVGAARGVVDDLMRKVPVPRGVSS